MRSEDEMIAYALETTPALLPYIPELLAGLEELGSDAELITRVLRDLHLPASTSVVDLGCGKGAVAVEIAEKLDFRVLGIELFEPFVTSCNELAKTHGVSDRCRFVHGDILKLAGKVEPADVAVLAALGDVLGRLDDTIAVIRRYVKPGGYMVISDAFVRAGGSTRFPGFEQYAEHDETIARLSACGDRLVREGVEAEDDDRADEDESEVVAARAKAVAAKHPEIAAEVLRFAESQSAENDYINTNLIGAVWVLSRT